ncbi:MAG: ribosome maturation factor RimP [Endomicrobia bacterium]|nr:ribosome maturation factor RimP [Endomicrobiia bacterium]
MIKKEVENKVSEIIAPVLEAGGYDLVDVQYVSSENGMVLRIYVDKDGGIKMRDCEVVTIMLSSILNDNRITDEDFYIEVSSPGIYRELKKEKDFLRHIGQRVKVKLYQSIETLQFGKQKVFFGKIKEYKDNKLYIILDNNSEVYFDMGIVAKVNLEPDISELFKK